jgi:hypothetical protein
VSSVADRLQQVLDFWSKYSATTTDDMRARDVATNELADALSQQVVDLVPLLGLTDLEIRVKAGGKQGSYGPVPWVRVYSERHSPSATKGFYLCYLFSTEGSRLYLSLMQGTSELRMGNWRPINDSATLRSRSAQARASLVEDAGPSAMLDRRLSIDLGSATVQSPYSKRRVANYESSNVLACEYPTRAVPGDEQLAQDLSDMLSLLALLHGADTTVDLTASDPVQPTDVDLRRVSRKTAAAAQGRQLDAASRKALEIYAEDKAVRYFEALKWSVERVGNLKLGYDLRCRRPGQELHVEVKGTQSSGERVILTPGEVRHNLDVDKCGHEHALYVVTDIQLSTGDGVRCTGGKELRLWPWKIDENLLMPTEYSYRVP